MKYIIYYKNSYARCEPVYIDSEYKNEAEAIERLREINDNTEHPAWIEEE